MHFKSIRNLFIAVAFLVLLISPAVEFSMQPALAKGPKLSASSDPAELRAFLRRVEEKIKTNPTAATYATKAQICEWLRDYKSAIPAISKAIKMEPDTIVFYKVSARMKTQIDDFDGAVRDWSSAIRLGEVSLETVVCRSASRLATRDYNGARSDALHAIKLSPENALAWYVRGAAEAELGSLDSALSCLNNAIKLDPNDIDSYRRRSTLLRRMGRNREAQLDFDKVRQLEERD